MGSIAFEENMESYGKDSKSVFSSSKERESRLRKVKVLGVMVGVGISKVIWIRS